MTKYLRSALIVEGGNLLYEMCVEYERTYRGVWDPNRWLLQRFADLRRDILALTEPETLESIERQKLLKAPGWTPTKAENAAIKAGTFVYDANPDVTIPQPSEKALYSDILLTLDAFPEPFQTRYRERIDQFAAKGHKSDRHNQKDTP